MQHRKLVLFIAASLDGYIAGENDDLEWLNIVEREGEDYGYQDFIQTVDTVIIGRKTYDKVLTLSSDFWHKGRKCYVLSSTKTGSDENVTFYNGDVKTLVEEIRKSEGLNIFCDGGAEVIFQLMQENLVDRYIVSIIPILLGSGVRLFKEGRAQQEITLTRCSTFPSGLVQLWYDRKK